MSPFGRLVLERIMHDFPASVQGTVRALEFCFPSLFPGSFLVTPIPCHIHCSPLLCWPHTSPWWGDSKCPTLMELHESHKHLWGANLTIQRGSPENILGLISLGKVLKGHNCLSPANDFENNFWFKGCQWEFPFWFICHLFSLQTILTT